MPKPDPIDAVDRYLAKTLVDPRSATNYRTSAVLNCKQVTSIRGECVCFSVNARNRMGGMTGSQISVAIMNGNDVVRTFGPNLLTIENTQSCERALRDRPADSIFRFVR
jgi:hypothetical protein